MLFCDGAICESPFSAVSTVVVLNGEIFYFDACIQQTSSFTVEVDTSLGFVVFM